MLPVLARTVGKHRSMPSQERRSRPSLRFRKCISQSLHTSIPSFKMTPDFLCRSANGLLQTAHSLAMHVTRIAAINATTSSQTKRSCPRPYKLHSSRPSQASQGSGSGERLVPWHLASMLVCDGKQVNASCLRKWRSCYTSESRRRRDRTWAGPRPSGELRRAVDPVPGLTSAC